MVNPYLLNAGVLKAFDDGLKRELDPGEPELQNMYEAVEQGKKVVKLPMTLGDALERLEEDEVIRSALPDEMYRVFTHYKRDEWERFLATVTEWDLEIYWDCLP
jgi:glutamine synthetase